MNFANLKKQSNNFDNLLKEVEKLSNPGYEKDETAELYWKPTPDKTGNALAVIRFLPGPAVDGEDAIPWVQYWDHGFQNKVTGKWYIERSLTSLGQKDPVSEMNSKLWNSTQDNDGPERKQARDQRRRLHYVANIYVVNDPQNKESEGKVFLFKFGKKIFDKITKMMNPDLESEPRINPFDLWKGANFKLKMTRQNVNMGGRSVSFPNYDESVFLTSGPLSEDDTVMENIWKSEHSLKEIVDPKHFKTYDELKRRLDDVMGHGAGDVHRFESSQSQGMAVSDRDDIPLTNSKPVAKKASAPVVEDEEDDPDLAEFRKLLDD